MASSNITKSQTPVQKEIHHPPGHIIVNHLWLDTTLLTILKRKVGVIIADHLGIVDFYCTNHSFMYISEGSLLMNNYTTKRTLVKFAKGSSDKKMMGILLVENNQNDSTKSHFESVQKFAVMELSLKLTVVRSQDDAAEYLAHMVNTITHDKRNPFNMPLQLPKNETKIRRLLFIIPTVGEVKVQSLLNKYSNLKQISHASEKELESVVGLATARIIFNFFHSDF